ncbi:MAG TPA: D-Ala-D-Ala carboxypeptidase family metallohydrolase [Solirubrobacteraceae bacterium]
MSEPTNRLWITTLAVLTLALAGCGSQGAAQSDLNASSQLAHPQVIEPTAGVQSGTSTHAGNVYGDVHAHAEPLSEVKRELKLLNLCGGATSSADASPIASSSGPGFVADPGTSQTEGELPNLTAQLASLGRALGVTIYGISGYRTPAQSVAVGGYATDPHTLGEAEDIGVNSLLRSSAARISEAELAQFGLYRPFDPSDNPNNTEVNHIQLIPAGGPVSLAEVNATWDPDPRCR